MGLPSILDEGTRKSQPFPEGTTTDPKDSGGNVQPTDKGLPSTASNEGTTKTTSCLEGPLGDKVSWRNKPPADMEPINLTVADPSSTGAKYQAFLLFEDELAQESDEEEVFAIGDDMKEYTQVDKEEHHRDLKKFDNTFPLTERQMIKYLRKVSRVLFSRITKEQWVQHEEDVVFYADLRAYAFNGATKTLKAIQDAVKEDPAMNKKILIATETFTKIYLDLTELLSFLKGFNYYDLQSTVKDLQAQALEQNEQLTAWLKSSTNLAWNLGSRLSGLERAQTHLPTTMSTLKQDTPDIKSMMTKIEGKVIASEEQLESTKELMPASCIELIISKILHFSINHIGNPNRFIRVPSNNIGCRHKLLGRFKLFLRSNNLSFSLRNKDVKDGITFLILSSFSK
nr:hypothetical protein [Tanacetum cinerariifolium]